MQTRFDAGRTGMVVQCASISPLLFCLCCCFIGQVRRQDIRQHYTHKTNNMSSLQQRFQGETDGTIGISILMRLISLQIYVNLHKSLRVIAAADYSPIIPAYKIAVASPLLTG